MSLWLVTVLRQWSLIIGRGGWLQNGRGGESEVLPLQKRGDRTSFSHAEEGAQVLR